MAALLLLSAACADTRPVRGKGEVPTYGLLNDELRRPDVQYRISRRNAVLAIIFSETLLWPAIVVCFYLYEPVPGQ